MTENAEPVGRREQNKIDTRRAIADAAFDLALSVGPGSFTVDQIAERAGVSRRTFFNYFHSAEDALTVRTDGFLDLALQVFGRMPQDEPLFDSIVRAFTETTRMEGLSQHGALFRMASTNPDLLRAQLRVGARRGADRRGAAPAASAPTRPSSTSQLSWAACCPAPRPPCAIGPPTRPDPPPTPGCSSKGASSRR